MILRSFVLFAAAVCFLPDEGQWLPTQVREMDWDALKKRGMVMTKDEFWHPENGGVLSATVQINGCTASFVSKDGLLVTNHHCGFSAISELSTPEKNLLRDGFAAATHADELPAPGVVASVLKRIEDVTAKVHAAQATATSDLERFQRTQETLAALAAEGEAKEANTKCTVASFLEGKEYHLYYRTQITDVRLVYAPPRAIGEFGGETDNWEWPRHTGDFSVFRAYVAPNGDVRGHHADNVPFQPKHFLTVSTEGVKEGDLALILGYPGRTQRYKTSRGVMLQQGFVFPRRHDVLTRAIAVLEAAGRTDEKLGLEVADRIKSLANVQKNAAGMLFGLRNNGTIARKEREESEFTAWLRKATDARSEWTTVLDEMFAMDDAEAATIERDTAIALFGMIAEDMPLLAAMVDGCAAATTTKDGKVPTRLLRAIANEALATNLDTVQKPLIRITMSDLASMSKAQRLPGTETLGADGFDEKAADAVFADTKMLTGAGRSEVFAGGRDAIAASTDPLVAIARAIATERLSLQKRMRERAGKMLDVGRRWIAAQEAFRGKSFYPDANSTLRVSIGQVAGYSPREAVTYAPQTTVAGILQKETGKEPFASPKALLEAAKSRANSRFFDKRLGDVPVCFLVNGDTTGGNSGSPVIDGRGRLIGLNFDRVFENVVGDFGWTAERSRNVVCDIRYVLWVMESVFPAPALVKELLG